MTTRRSIGSGTPWRIGATPLLESRSIACARWRARRGRGSGRQQQGAPADRRGADRALLLMEHIREIKDGRATDPDHPTAQGLYRGHDAGSPMTHPVIGYMQR